MKKKMIMMSGVAMAVLLSFNACDSTGRYSENESGIIDKVPGTGAGLVSTNPEPFKPVPATGTITPIDTNTTSGGDNNQTEDTYKTINGVYSVKITPEFDSITSGQTQNIHFEVTNFFTKKPADDRAITKMSFEIDKRYAEFFDAAGNHGNVIEFSSAMKNAKSVGDLALKSSSKSGEFLVNFNAVIDGTDVNLTKSFPIVIEKNRSSSMAIIPIGTTYADGLFTEKFVIHVVDSYGNKAKDGTRISTGVINNPKLYSNAYDGATSIRADKDQLFSDENQTYTITSLDDQTLPHSDKGILRFDISKYWKEIRTPLLDENNSVVLDENNETKYMSSFTAIYYESLSDVKYKNDVGSLNNTTGTFSIAPVKAEDVITSDISSLDTLIVLANKRNHKPENLGGWDIERVIDDKTLKLVNLDHKDVDLNGVSYVIGDEYRYIDHGQTIANGAVSTFETTEVKDGLAYAELRYTPELVGHNVFIYANTRLEGKRIGISRNILLHGTGLVNKTLVCTNENGIKPDCSRLVRIVQKDSGKGAYRVNIARPQVVGESTYRKATATRTNDTGWTLVSIYGIDENKTATVEFGDLIFDEYIINEH